GWGVVYRAWQHSLKRPVAVKMILSGHLASPVELERFFTDARAAATLDHSGIVPIYEIGEDRGQHFFSMALVEGGRLQKALADGRLPPAEAARLVRHVAEAVQYAHEHAIIHRDLSPRNILLTAAEDGGRGTEGRLPKLIDFGMARTAESDLSVT